jgi:pimeloyl-ACP methyl ester carboxylesterase
VATAVFVHGVPNTSNLWGPVIEHLDGTRKVVAVDLPGFAEPAPEGWRGTKEDYVDWLIAEIERIAGEDGPVHLVGHDWGSLLACRVASLRPELLRSLTYSNGPLDEHWPLHFMFEIWATPGEGERWMAELTPEEAVAQMEHAGLPASIARDNAWETPGNRELTLTLYRSAINVGREWAPDLPKIVLPSMALWSDRDLLVPIEMGRRMAAKMGSEVVALNGHHYWPGEVPREASVALQSLWERSEAETYTIHTQPG